MVMPIAFRIIGEAASKANSREIGVLKFKDKTTGESKARPTVRKSDAALAFERDALRQIPPWARQRLVGPIRIFVRIFYSSERADLDESIVLDVLQDRWGKRLRDGSRPLLQAGVYRNDRQVREKHIYHGIDAANPHVDLRVEALEAQPVDMFAAPIGTMLDPLVDFAAPHPDGMSF